MMMMEMDPTLLDDLQELSLDKPLTTNLKVLFEADMIKTVINILLHISRHY